MKKNKKLKKMLYMPVLAALGGIVSIASACNGASTAAVKKDDQSQEQNALEKLVLESELGGNKEYAYQLADKIKGILKVLEQTDESGLTSAEFANFFIDDDQRIDVKAIRHYHNDFEFDNTWRIVRDYKKIQKAVADDSLTLELSKPKESPNQLVYYLTIKISPTLKATFTKIVTIKKFLPVPIYQILKSYVWHQYIVPTDIYSMDEDDPGFKRWKKQFYPPTVISPQRSDETYIQKIRDLAIRDGLHYFPARKILEGELGKLGVFAVIKDRGNPNYTALIYYNSGSESHYYEEDYATGHDAFDRIYNAKDFLSVHEKDLKAIDPATFDVSSIRRHDGGAYLRINAYNHTYTTYFDYKHYLNSIAMDAKNNIIGVYANDKLHYYILWLYFDKASRTVKVFRDDHKDLIFTHPPKEQFTETGTVDIYWE